MISFNNVSFSYGGLGASPVLTDLCLQVPAGAFVCLMGGNGSGKSTVARLVNGLLQPTAGTVEVCGMDTQDGAKTNAVRSCAALVFQNPDDALVTSVVRDEVAFGPGNLGLPVAEIERRVAASLAHVGLEGFEGCVVTELSGGQKQRVALAGALAMEPQVLVLDEPTAMLDPRSRREVRRVVQRLHAEGMTVLWITHDPEEALLAQRVVVLQDGAVVADLPPEELFANAPLLEQAGLAAPASVSSLLEISEAAQASRNRKGTEAASTMGGASPQGETLMEVRDVSFSYGKQAQPALAGVSLTVHAGEIVSVVGATGSGKSTLLRLLARLEKPTCGAVLLRGRDLAAKDGLRACRQAVGVSFQYPEQQLFAASVEEDVAFGPRNRGWDRERVARQVEAGLAAVGLTRDVVGSCSPFALSGGQQRRVALAGVLALDTPVLLLDEPAAGLDHRGRQMLLALLETLRDQGKAVVLVSHNMREVAQVSNTVIVLRDGQVAAAGTPAEVFAQPALLEACGLL